MRVLVLCAATFLGGVLAGAVFWPTSAPAPRRTPEGAREAQLPPPEGASRAAHGAEADGPGAAAAASVPRGDVPLRTLAHEAERELGRSLERPAARAFLEGKGRVIGGVFDAAGMPVRGVIVTASSEAQPLDLAADARRARERAHEDVDLGAAARNAIENELWRREVRRTATTDSEGRYELKGLVEGWHRVTAYHDDYDLKPDGQNRVQPDAVVDFRAQPVGLVTVEVRMPDGELADSAWISWQGPGNGWDQWLPDRAEIRLPKAPCRVRAQIWFPEPLQSAEVEYDAGTAAGPLVLKLEGRRMLVARLVPADGLAVPEGAEFRLRRVEGGANVDPMSLKDDQARGASSAQGRATWYDLEPGRYLIAAFLSGRYLLAHGVAQMGAGSTTVDLAFEAPPPGTYVTARVVVPEGGAVQGSTRFALVTGSASSAPQKSVDVLRRMDGSWLVLLPEAPPEGGPSDAWLRVYAGSYGAAQEPFDLRRPGTVTLRFREPARLKVVVDRYAGSGVEGRLFASLYGDEGTVSTRQIEADGRCDLGSIQPRDYTLLLFVRDHDTRWTILTSKVALRTGDQEESVAVPSLHTLRVRPSPQLRAGEVTLLSSDPSIGWMRRSARVVDGVATFDFLAAAQYEIRCGNKRVEARVPGPDEVRVE